MKLHRLNQGRGLRRTLLLATLLPALSLAAGDHEPGLHDDGGQDDHAGEAMGHGSTEGHGQGHAHDKWVKPPERYQDLSSRVWGDPSAAARGRVLYAQNCQVCHGSDGQGTGVAADSLEHPPADLTSHLHSRYGNNDSYLFWRVSKGGTVEPFKSQNSAMPAFEDTLTEQQRWDILAYIHDVYHRGFVEDLKYEKENGDDGSSGHHGEATQAGHHDDAMADQHHADGGRAGHQDDN